jgi:hypothetical protein
VYTTGRGSIVASRKLVSLGYSRRPRDAASGNPCFLNCSKSVRHQAGIGKVCSRSQNTAFVICPGAHPSGRCEVQLHQIWATMPRLSIGVLADPWPIHKDLLSTKSSCDAAFPTQIDGTGLTNQECTSTIQSKVRQRRR